MAQAAERAALADQAVSPPEQFPRLLFITPAAFNRVTGGGITFTNLFTGWPRDRIATVHCDPVTPSAEICERYYALTARELRRFPAVRSGRGANPGDEPKQGATRHGGLTAVKQVLFGNGLPEWGVVTAELRAFVAAFRPELIYTILGSNAVLDLIAAIRRESGARLVVHFMDDWPSAIYRGGLFSFVPRAKMRRRLRQLVQSATCRLAIGETMAEEYTHLYGLPFKSFQNAVAANRWAELRGDPGRVGSPARVVYTGSILGFAQAESLIACCAAIAALRRSGAAVRLEIYSPGFQVAPLRQRLALDDAITIHETIAEDDAYFRVLADADMLLLLANFDPASMRYVRLSMPTKLPAYLASGTPILAYGPPSLAQIAYARQDGWGLVVDEPFPTRLVDGILTLLVDRDMRRRLSTTARALAAERHDIASVRERFQRCLIDAAAQPS
jgi:glycosyltransferase involved in cell wall biosynthesis